MKTTMVTSKGLRVSIGRADTERASFPIKSVWHICRHRQQGETLRPLPLLCSNLNIEPGDFNCENVLTALLIRTYELELLYCTVLLVLLFCVNLPD
eukprot:scaffold296950_cov30-Prasinocladus_malaysianus.AAC.1